jgi:hypothetical protein
VLGFLIIMIVGRCDRKSAMALIPPFSRSLALAAAEILFSICPRTSSTPGSGNSANIGLSPRSAQKGNGAGTRKGIGRQSVEKSGTQLGRPFICAMRDLRPEITGRDEHLMESETPPIGCIPVLGKENN